MFPGTKKEKKSGKGILDLEVWTLQVEEGPFEVLLVVEPAPTEELEELLPALALSWNASNV